MTDALLRQTPENEARVKSLAVFPPSQLRAGLSDVAWKILQHLHETPSYPGQIAEELDVHEQTVYYHMRSLRENGLITAVEESEDAAATYYKPVADVFAAELPGEGTVFEMRGDVDPGAAAFFEPFLGVDGFTGRIVVGAPTEHGPYHTEARDGHHGISLGMFLGQFTALPRHALPVVTDEEAREHGLDEDLILIGGPLVNTVTHKWNDAQPIHFTYGEKWEIVSERSGDTYTAPGTGVVSRFANPVDETCTVVVLAGLQAVGTQACIKAVTHHSTELFTDFTEGESFHRVIQGTPSETGSDVSNIRIRE